MEDVQRMVDIIPNLKDDMKRSSAIRKAEKYLKSANGTRRSFKMEIRLVQDPSQKQAIEQKFAQMSDRLKALAADVKALKQEEQRDELFVGRHGGEEKVDEDDAIKKGDNMLKDASRLQDKTQESLENTKRLVAESKEVGMTTLEELQRQRQQIQDIDKQAMRMENELERADKLIKAFGKRMASDKFIQCCTCLNVLLMVGVVIYIIVNGGNIGGAGEKEPESPVRRLTALRGGDIHNRLFVDPMDAAAAPVRDTMDAPFVGVIGLHQ